MLTLKLIQSNPDFVIERLKVKNFDATQIINQVNELNTQRKLTQTRVDNLKAEMNNLSKEIGNLFKEEKHRRLMLQKKKTAELKEEIKNLTRVFRNRRQLNNLLYAPNIPIS
jgi:seryl-tRNA synthetase